MKIKITRKAKKFIAAGCIFFALLFSLSFIGNLSNGFENWDVAEWTVRERNADNLLSGNFTDYNKGNGITATADNNGVITLKGEYVGDEEKIVIPVQNVVLNPGTYTISGAPNGSVKTYHIQVKYVNQSGAELYAVSDFDDSTFILDTNQAVEVSIVVYPNCEIKRGTIKPVLVEGTEIGEFFA